jgi:Putative transposase
MTLATGEFIRRFLIHVLPQGFHRIRHYGLFAGTAKADNIATARRLLGTPVPHMPPEANGASDAPAETLSTPCPCCGGRMRIIEIFRRGQTPPTPAIATPDRDPDRHVMMISLSRRKLRAPASSSGGTGQLHGHWCRIVRLTTLPLLNAPSISASDPKIAFVAPPHAAFDSSAVAKSP